MGSAYSIICKKESGHCLVPDHVLAIGERYVGLTVFHHDGFSGCALFEVLVRDPELVFGTTAAVKLLYQKRVSSGQDNRGLLHRKSYTRKKLWLLGWLLSAAAMQACSLYVQWV